MRITAEMTARLAATLRASQFDPSERCEGTLLDH